jgi:cytochrome c553
LAASPGSQSGEAAFSFDLERPPREMSAISALKGFPLMLRSVVVAALLSAATAAWADAIADKVEVCSACHGEKGLPAEPAIPIIWGQNQGYLYLELRDFQKGARKDDQMTPIAQSLSKEDALALAAYFAAKPWPKTGAPDASKADVTSAMTAIKSVVCTSCHLEQFEGDSSVPRLAGQERDYLAKTMTDFRTRARANNPGMSDLMNTVTPEQVTAIAAYLAGL